MTRLQTEKRVVSTALDKLRRVQRMPAREALYRLGERMRTEFERTRTRLMPAPRKTVDLERLRPGSPSFLEYLRGAPARRFYFQPSARVRIFQWMAREFPRWIDTAAADAEKLRRHRIPILGFGECDLGPDIDWHRDPVTGRSWPRKFWTDYDPVRECDGGDAKVIHELNRHAHLPKLAKAFFLTGEEADAREVVAQLRSWIAQNPPSFGINWQSSLEIALRCTSWVWALFFMLPARALDEDSARIIGASLFAQLEHVCRYPSIYSSPNTHLIGEATALFIAGVLFQEHRGARRWRRRGLALLLEQLKRQILPDGVHVELSTGYHCYTVDFGLQAVALAQRNSIELPQAMSDALLHMIEFLMHAALPDGSIPQLGDDDGGRALQLTAADYRAFPEAFCAAAVLFGRPEFRFRAGGFREDTFWLLGEDALGMFTRLDSAPPAATAASFPSAGYFIQRSDWGLRADHLIFDCGGLGQPSGGHGHADALSFTLAPRGEEMLVDPGTFVYNGAPRWREYFRGTVAHNTVTVDGACQSETGGTFRWKSRARARVRRRFDARGLHYVEGEHDGYARLGTPVTHRRRLLYAGGYWTVLDELAGDGEHDLEATYHFAPGARVAAPVVDGSAREVRLSCAVGEAGLAMTALGSAPVAAELVTGRERPIQGWVSRRYGHRQPAPALAITMTAPLPALSATVLIPFDASDSDGAPPARLLPSRPGVLACEVQGTGWRDIIVLSPSGAEDSVAGLTLAGEFFRIRLNGSADPMAVFGTGVRSVTQGGAVLFDTNTGKPAPVYFSGAA